MKQIIRLTENDIRNLVISVLNEEKEISKYNPNKKRNASGVSSVRFSPETMEIAKEWFNEYTKDNVNPEAEKRLFERLIIMLAKEDSIKFIANRAFADCNAGHKQTKNKTNTNPNNNTKNKFTDDLENSDEILDDEDVVEEPIVSDTDPITSSDETSNTSDEPESLTGNIGFGEDDVNDDSNPNNNTRIPRSNGQGVGFRLPLPDAAESASLFYMFMISDHSDVASSRSKPDSIILVTGDRLKDEMAGAISVNNLPNFINNYFTTYCKYYWYANRHITSGRNNIDITSDAGMNIQYDDDNDSSTRDVIERILADYKSGKLNRIVARYGGRNNQMVDLSRFNNDVLISILSAVKLVDKEGYQEPKRPNEHETSRAKRLAYQLYLEKTPNPMNKSSFMQTANRVIVIVGNLINLYRSIMAEEVNEARRRKQLNRIVNETINRVLNRRLQ